MVKYIIEGGLNFNDELYKSISLSDKGELGELGEIKESEEPEEPEEPGKTGKTGEPIVCLITGTPLTEHFIKLECGHTFNYVPLYYDILNHKKKFNTMENKTLKTTQLRCPYCRNIQSNLLPYHKFPGVKQVHGVNYFDEKVIIKHMGCCHNNLDYIVGKCEYESCPTTSVLLLKENNKCYCIYHKYKMINILTIEHHNKIKQEKMELHAKIMKQINDEKLAKKEAKEKAILAKQMAKQMEKEQIKAAKNEAKNAATCSIILKSGKNKNCPCSNTIHKDLMCSRHYKLSQNPS
jgi:hypothetical protein